MNIFLDQTELNTTESQQSHNRVTTESQSHIWEEAGYDDDDADDKVNDDDDDDDDHCGISKPRVEWGWLGKPSIKKKGNFVNKIHKTLPPPPRPTFMNAYFLFFFAHFSM